MNTGRRRSLLTRLQAAGSIRASSFDDPTADTQAPAVWLMLVAILPVLIWSAVNAPRVSQIFASLLAAAALLEVVAPDTIRFGRRIVGPAFCVAVAGYVLYGAPVAVLIGCARGIVRAVNRRSEPMARAQSISWAILTPLFAALLAAVVERHATPLLGTLTFVGTVFSLEIFASAARFAGPAGVASPDAWRGFFPWAPFMYGAFGVVGYVLAGELVAGRFLALLFLTVPFVIVRASMGAAGWGTERYVAALERENDALLNRTGQFDRANGDLIEALAIAIDEQDGAERGRTRRIAQVATRIGSGLGLSGWNLEVLRRAALLHDVGILALPTGERGAAHCELGARLVARWRDGRIITQVIEQHHERVDGSGYPLGLTGDQIVMEARIVAVAEVFVNMTSGAAAVSTLDALDEVDSRCGSEFDPQIVEALRQVAEPRTADVLPMARKAR